MISQLTGENDASAVVSAVTSTALGHLHTAKNFLWKKASTYANGQNLGVTDYLPSNYQGYCKFRSIGFVFDLE